MADILRRWRITRHREIDWGLLILVRRVDRLSLLGDETCRAADASGAALGGWYLLKN